MMVEQSKYFTCSGACRTPFVHISTVSQRYADSKELQLEIPIPDLRSQDTKNRQNSIDDINPRDKVYGGDDCRTLQAKSQL